MPENLVVHVRTMDGKKNHYVIGKRNRPNSQGFVKLGESRFYLDPRYYYREEWPDNRFPGNLLGKKRSVFGIDFLDGKVGPVPIFPHPEVELPKNRTSWALEQFVNSKNTDKALGSEKGDPLFIALIISILANILIAMAAFVIK